MYVAAARKQRARQNKGKGGPKGGKGGKKGGSPNGPKNKKNKPGKAGAAGEADPAQDSTVQQEEPVGEDLWSGAGVEFEAIQLDESGRPFEAE